MAFIFFFFELDEGLVLDRLVSLDYLIDFISYFILFAFLFAELSFFDLEIEAFISNFYLLYLFFNI